MFLDSTGPVSGASRRRFLQRLGGTAAAAAGTTLLPSVAVAQARHGRLAAPERAQQAFNMRVQAAQQQYARTATTHPENGDELRHAGYMACFHKSLPHDTNGMVDPRAYEALLHACQSGDPAAFAAVPMGGRGRLANPLGAFAFEMVGADAHAFTIPAAPTVAGTEAAAELVELYWLALTRDVPYSRYGSDPLIARAADSLSRLKDFKAPREGGRITPRTIFRGLTPGELDGPLISQFLVQDCPSGAMSLVQRIRTAEPGRDYLQDQPSWLRVQSGGAPAAFVPATSTTYVRTGRDLAAYLYRDYTYQAFLTAALILLDGGYPLAPGHPYRAVANQGAFTSFGPPEVLDLVTHAANLALRATWFQKWVVHRRLRPEAMAGLAHLAVARGAQVPIHQQALTSDVMQAAFEYNGRQSYLLPMAYPEGSPVHPSYPAGHAAIAGACVTILKAFFDETATLQSAVVPGADGTALEPYRGAPLTVGGELNKLASNISLGRDTAGVHYRSDGVEGMNLGEQVAISILQDVRSCHAEPFGGFEFTNFEGRVVTV